MCIRDRISAAAEAAPDEHPDIIALISVGAVTPTQLDLLLRRVRRTFPRSQIVIAYWEEREPQSQRDGADTEGIRYADSVASLIDLVGRIADQQHRTTELAPRMEAVAGA